MDKSKAFKLVIHDHVQPFNPVDHGVDDIRAIDPADYFVTSGDAVEKAKVLAGDLWDVAKQAKAKYGSSKNKKHKALIDEIWRVASRASQFIRTLEGVRGDAIFLETDWLDHTLYVVPKNPRSKDDAE